MPFPWRSFARWRRTCGILVAAVVIFIAALARAAELPALTVPDALGVNIHFTDPRPGELEMLANSGARFVRMDFDWHRTEPQRGQYDFAPYDRLLGALDQHGIQAVLILDYVHPLYDDNRSPHTDSGREAFAKWAAAAVAHFKGRHVIWEMYNEPNILPFWRPKPNAEDYVKLALAVGKAIRTADPGATYIGPACSTIDLPFLEACFKSGLLEYFDAVSVHPYGADAPENRAEEYRSLRLLIEKYRPPAKKGRPIPILSGEWGYSSIPGSLSEDLQGEYLARQWLFNLSQEIPLSIWYDWHEDGPDPKENEHHFGMVRYEYHPGRAPVYDEKPAYRAARTLAEQLGGCSFNKRLWTGDEQDYVLLFTRGDDPRVRIAAWTTATQLDRDVKIPASAGKFTVVGHTGEKRPEVESDGRWLTIRLSDAPQYLVPERSNDSLRAAAAVSRAPMDIPATRERLTREHYLSFQPPHDLVGWRMDGGDAFGSGWRRAQWMVPPPEGGARRRVVLSVPLRAPGVAGSPEATVYNLGQPSMLVISDPLSALVLPPAGDLQPIRIENPAGTPFDGHVEVCIDRGVTSVDPLQLKQGQTELMIMRTLPAGRSGAGHEIAVQLTSDKGKVLCREPAVRLLPIALGADSYALAPGGDSKVKSSQKLLAVTAPDGLPLPGEPALRIDYRLAAGWKYLCVSPRPHPQDIEGRPAALGLWVYGDGSRNHARLRFVDATGQTFQPDAEPLTWTGWRYIRFDLSGHAAGRWGGAADGIVHYPIRLETLLLIDSAARQPTQGTVYIASPVLIYKPQRQRQRQ